jgi:outer membrane protein assembly factor BamB
LSAPLDQVATGASGLASFDEPDGTRYLVASGASDVSAFKIAERDGKAALQPVWRSREMEAPQAPIVVNGVVFAAAGPVIYALDAMTGKDLWNSGKTIGAPIRSGISAGNMQVFATAADGTLYAFGFPIEH